MVCQKAPSAKRCIKTQATGDVSAAVLHGQKAPSAKRCIKTNQDSHSCVARSTRQKAPSAKRCIKTSCLFVWTCRCGGSESTERQKVH